MSGVLTPTYERIVIATVAARTATETFGPFPRNRKHRGIYLLLDVESIDATPSLVMKLQGRWEVGDSWTDLLTDAAVSANGYLPPEYQVVVTAGDADEAVYGIVGWLLT
jgi:hypothetical protein